MGYDRNDVWMTCGERDDREAQLDELALVIQKAWNNSRDGFEMFDIAEAVFNKFIVLRKENKDVAFEEKTKSEAKGEQDAV